MKYCYDSPGSKSDKGYCDVSGLGNYWTKKLEVVTCPYCLNKLKKKKQIQSPTLADLVEAVDLMLEYNTPNRIANVMLMVENYRKLQGRGTYGWGSWLAAEGWKLENYDDYLIEDKNE